MHEAMKVAKKNPEHSEKNDSEWIRAFVVKEKDEKRSHNTEKRRKTAG